MITVHQGIFTLCNNRFVIKNKIADTRLKIFSGDQKKTMHQKGGKFTGIYRCKDLLSDPVTDERYVDTIDGCKHEVLIKKLMNPPHSTP